MKGVSFLFKFGLFLSLKLWVLKIILFNLSGFVFNLILFSVDGSIFLFIPFVFNSYKRGDARDVLTLQKA